MYDKTGFQLCVSQDFDNLWLINMVHLYFKLHIYLNNTLKYHHLFSPCTKISLKVIIVETRKLQFFCFKFHGHLNFQLYKSTMSMRISLWLGNKMAIYSTLRCLELSEELISTWGWNLLNCFQYTCTIPYKNVQHKT